jgi:hypothetical protein
MPEGLALDPNLLAIEGRPVEAGTFTISLRVEDADQRSDEATLALEVIPDLHILTSTLPPALVGAPYLAPLEAAGGSPPYSWRVASNLLPDGLYLVGESIEGTPQIAGEFAFSLAVSDSRGQDELRSYAIRVE